MESKLNLFITNEKRNRFKIVLNPKLNKISLIFISFILLLILTLQLINANFVCGQVKDSINNNSASWYSVRVYYPDKINNYSSCEISPEENKFCCDAGNISGKPFKIGQTIYSEVYDTETGYAAGPVNLISTSEGYDVFPVMQLEKVINIYNPKSRIILSNSSSIMLNSSFLPPYNIIQLDNNFNRTILCNNCSIYQDNASFQFGMNNPKIIASNGNRNFFENLNFAILKTINFSRNEICDKCKKNSVVGSKNISMKVVLNLSNEISGMEIREYVPISFKILDAKDGLIKPYSSTHNVIIWNVSGKDILESYTILSPKKGILNTQYIFKSEIEEINLTTDNIIVRGFLPFFSIHEKGIFDSTKKKKYPKVAPNKALVLNLNNKNILQVAVFPNKKLNNAEFELKSYLYKGELEDVLEYYIFDTNIDLKDMSKLYIKFKIDKKSLKNKGYNNVSLYGLKDSTWEKADLNLIRQDKLSYYYDAYINPAEGFVIVGEK